MLSLNMELLNYKYIKMKKLFIIPFFIFSLSAFAQSSVYHPMPDSAAIWNFDHSFFCQWGGAHVRYSLTLDGDTLLNGIHYKKLYMPRADYVPSYQCYPQDTISGYKGALRQDTSARIVYIVPPDSLTEQLLYDFKMNVGDTVKGYLAGYFPNIVVSVDSVMVGASFRKRWMVDETNNVYFIEGIGSTYGLIRALPGGAIIDYDQIDFLCFQQNGVTLYPDTNSQCGLILSRSEIPVPQEAVRVYPNPSDSWIQIDIDLHADVEEIRLTGLNAQLLYQRFLLEEKSVRIDYLENGVYILTVITKDQQRINKKIVICR